MRAPRGWTRVAESLLLADGSVGLTVLDAEHGEIARHFHTNGVDLHAERRMVRPDEPAAYLGALLNQPNLSYYRFTDESDTPEASAP